MQIGWIDFSKEDRDKAVSVLDLLSEQGVLDELGIAPIRDGFSNLFFPGITTIQTRAKYFLMIPYIFQHLESNTSNDPYKLKKELNDLEKECASLLVNSGATRVIGSNSFDNPQWVKRPPSSIYWAGLKTYRIFKYDISIDQYIRKICSRNYLKESIAKSGNFKDNYSAGDIPSSDYWSISYPGKDWMENLEMGLTKKEGEFLKSQIIKSCPNSLFAFILKNDCRCILNCNSFSDLADMSEKFPHELKTKVELAKCFSEFNSVLGILFNSIISDDEKVEESFLEIKPRLKNISEIRLESIFQLFKKRDGNLERFLLGARDLMAEEKIDELKDLIKKREIYLKGENRSKTFRPEQNKDNLISVYDLEYRFDIAKIIADDIFKSQDIYEDKCLTKGEY